MLINRIIVPDVFILGKPLDVDIEYYEETDPHSGVTSKYNSKSFSVSFENSEEIKEKIKSFPKIDEALVVDYRGNDVSPGRIEVLYRGVRCTEITENENRVTVKFKSDYSSYYIKPF